MIPGKLYKANEISRYLMYQTTALGTGIHFKCIEKNDILIFLKEDIHPYTEVGHFHFLLKDKKIVVECRRNDFSYPQLNDLEKL